MPNETLIGQLDALRDTYLQRNKATTTLLSTLKGVADAHAKAQRILRDFSAQNPGLDIARTQEAFTETRLKEEAIDPLLPELRRKLKELASLTGALKDASQALRSEPVDVVRLDRALALLQAGKETDVAALLPALSEELDLAQRRLGDEFGGKLREAMLPLGVAVGGRAPKFELGRFELDANFARRIITLRYGKDLVAPRVPITVDAAAKAYEGANKAVMGRNQDGAAWMAHFAEAYERARRKREVGADAGAGARVNIVDCYLEMVLLRQGRAFLGEPSKRTFTEYGRAQFAYDFYEFTGRQRLLHKGRRVKAHSATKSQTDNPTKSFWIVEGDTPYDGRYIADVEFVHE